MKNPEPFVSVVTPVYNGAKYLAECIESVLAQTHQNWEYIIVNNCSTDDTLQIAEKYAASDSRIRVVTNSNFVGVIENHNICFRLISPESKYCKVVCADDWIYPECLSRMVEVGERYPTVAIVGAYTINLGGVIWLGIPLHKSVITGEQACRSHLLGGPKIMGPPSSVLFRSDVVRSSDPFFPGSALCADEASYYRSLRNRDFGFVHQILSFERIHDRTLNSDQKLLNAYILNSIGFLLEYGDAYTTPQERNKRLRDLTDEYYDYLAIAFIHCYPRRYWEYHAARRREIGLELDQLRFGKAIVLKILDLALNPKLTLEKILRVERDNDVVSIPDQNEPQPASLLVRRA